MPRKKDRNWEKMFTFIAGFATIGSFTLAVLSGIYPNIFTIKSEIVEYSIFGGKDLYINYFWLGYTFIFVFIISTGILLFLKFSGSKNRLS